MEDTSLTTVDPLILRHSFRDIDELNQAAAGWQVDLGLGRSFASRSSLPRGQRRSWSRMSLGQSILAWREAQARTEAAPNWLSGFAIGG